jgi:hypothetical protein
MKNFSSEERMSRNLKAIFGDFVAMGTPTTTTDWRPFTAESGIFYEMENGIAGRRFRSEKAFLFWHHYLPRLAEQLQLSHLLPLPGGKVLLSRSAAVAMSIEHHWTVPLSLQ